MRKLSFLLIFALISLLVLPGQSQTTDTVFSAKTIKYENIIIKGQLDFSLQQWKDSSWTREVEIEMIAKSDKEFNLCVYIFDSEKKSYIFKILGIMPAGEYNVTARMWFMPDGRHVYEIWY